MQLNPSPDAQIKRAAQHLQVSGFGDTCHQDRNHENFAYGMPAGVPNYSGDDLYGIALPDTALESIASLHAGFVLARYLTWA